MTANPTMDPASPEQQAPGALSIDDDGIAWLILDDPAKRVNTLSSRLFRWFSEQVARLERERPRGLVILSGKADNFVAGADIEELQGLTRPEEVLELLGQGHELTRRLDHLPFPTVAAIHGSCLGGGLELALCCDLRVASDHEKTKLGLPEVQLGLIPGMGGTQRLPRLIGVPDALDLILTGKQVSARAARRLGLVDELCDRHDLAQAALAMLAEAGEGAVAKRRKRNRAFASRAGDLLAKSFLGEKFVYDRARDQVLEKTGGHYPAPLVAVDRAAVRSLGRYRPEGTIRAPILLLLSHRSRITGGNVGVGETNPLAKLHVNGGVGSLSTGLAFGDGDTGSVLEVTVSSGTPAEGDITGATTFSGSPAAVTTRLAPSSPTLTTPPSSTSPAPPS